MKPYIRMKHGKWVYFDEWETMHAPFESVRQIYWWHFLMGES